MTRAGVRPDRGVGWRRPVSAALGLIALLAGAAPAEANFASLRFQDRTPGRMGNTNFSFSPSCCTDGATYTVTVPASVTAVQLRAIPQGTRQAHWRSVTDHTGVNDRDRWPNRVGGVRWQIREVDVDLAYGTQEFQARSWNPTPGVSNAQTAQQCMTMPSCGVTSQTITVRITRERPLLTLTLTPDTIDESGAGNTSTVTATLSPAAPSSGTTVTVAPVAGAYTVGPNADITFASGSTTSTDSVTITAVDNDAGEGDRVVTVAVTAADHTIRGAALTILDDDGGPPLTPSTGSADEARLKGVNEAILPDLSRAMTASTLDAVAGRIGQALSGGGAAASGPAASAEALASFADVLGANEQAHREGAWSWKQGLAGRSFALPLSGAGGEDAGAQVAMWGAGDYRRVDAGEGSGIERSDGRVFGAHVGMDARSGPALAGLALSLSEGRFDYKDGSDRVLGEAVKGKYESRMRSAHPYVGWTRSAGTHVWASLGFGRGEVAIIDDEAGRQKSDSKLRSAAAGGSVRVRSGEGSGGLDAMRVDLKGEAWTTRLEVEGNGGRIAGLKVETHQFRAAAAGSRSFTLAEGAAFTPSVELGVRLDRGDGETGAGMEVGGGLDYAHPGRGWSADLSGRTLVAHGGGTEEWSVGGSVRLEPSSGRGLSLRVAPSYGRPAAGVGRLWERGASAPSGGPRSARLDAEMGWGLPAYAGVLTPWCGLGLSEDDTRGYRVGARFVVGPSFELGLEGERRESGAARAEHGLMLRGRARF